ncbi:hypothetical protein BD626DRAFT_415213 [Schizophyllum amplum]|uniref:Uncharacterized protein n=1 Tax=Schizophyllum amplum TaxID=97359 RepID=A0A550BTL3_9AGAR|nr:hypothetical protein BD626DRAFT_415213 [Auriculariopsis ampla]
MEYVRVFSPSLLVVVVLTLHPQIPGVTLASQWSGMTREQRQEVCIKIAQIWAQLFSLRFPSVGSLYEAALSGPVNNGVTIGPMTVIVGPMTFIPSPRGDRTAPPDPSRCGPFTSLKEWLLAIARLDMAFGDPRPLSETVRGFIALVVADIEAAPDALFGNPRTSAIVLEHIDLLPHNVLVRPDAPTDVLAIIDWEGARTVPLWAVQPRFVNQCLDEYEEYVALIERTLGELVPAWADARNGEECREARRLYVRAHTSTWDPESVDPDWTIGPM